MAVADVKVDPFEIAAAFVDQNAPRSLRALVGEAGGDLRAGQHMCHRDR